ncbi:hypothetical protein AB0A05_26820 [Streptomyces sp. NPDC046374]|uniref:hypothetical protein n=1 Tax=Streptomyces sp. NPDC046374 TaxID=3154917 RepID=UPI0033EBC95E
MINDNSTQSQSPSSQAPARPNPSTYLTGLIQHAMDRLMPDGAFPGGQILDVQVKEGRDHKGDECGPQVSITFQADIYGDRPVHCVLHIEPDWV